jgi:hypothetical protein
VNKLYYGDNGVDPIFETASSPLKIVERGKLQDKGSKEVHQRKLPTFVGPPSRVSTIRDAPTNQNSKN